MNVTFRSKIPWLPLVLLWLAYTLLGWYLSAHHIFLFVGAFVTVVALAVVRKSSPMLEHLLRFNSQGLFAALILVSSVILAATWSTFLALIFMLFLTTFLAEVEMRFAGFSQVNTFCFLTLIAGFGVGIGELIDIVVLPSMRY